jgi:hypothetical protein
VKEKGEAAIVAWKRTARFIAALAVAATLTACGSQPLTSPGAAGSPPPTTAGRTSPPATPGSPPQATANNSPAVVVHLAAAFSPVAVRLRAGQRFLLRVSPGVQAKGLDAAGCGSPAGGMAVGGLLSVRCAAGGYLYTAGHPGTGVISATVWPRCSPGQMCPQWLTEPQLHVTIT